MPRDSRHVSCRDTMNIREKCLHSARKWLNMPEINVALFAFFLNFLWEMWQAPFFEELINMPHWEATKMCTEAAAGDAVIATVSFWGVALATRTRAWILRPHWRTVAGFVALGVMITIIVEAFAVGSLDRWQYAEVMPTLPFLGTGLLPILQWIIIPPLVVWFVRRQLT